LSPSVTLTYKRKSDEEKLAVHSFRVIIEKKAIKLNDIDSSLGVVISRVINAITNDNDC